MAGKLLLLYLTQRIIFDMVKFFVSLLTNFFVSALLLANAGVQTWSVL